MTTDEPARPPAAPPAASQAAMWWALAGVVVASVLAVTADARIGVQVLALELAALAVVRLVAPPPGPAGVTARSKAFDVALLGGAAIAMGYLSFTIATPAIVMG